jgi:hypothetical protein
MDRDGLQMACRQIVFDEHSISFLSLIYPPASLSKQFHTQSPTLQLFLKKREKLA